MRAAPIFTLLLSVPAGTNPTTPEALAEAMRACIPVFAVSGTADHAELHPDTDPPPGGVLVWAPPDQTRPLEV